VLQGAAIVTPLVVNQAEIVERGGFELPVIQLASDGDAAGQLLDGLLVLSHLPVNQAQVAEVFAFFQTLAQFLLRLESALEVIERPRVVAQALVAIANVAESDGFTTVVLRLTIERQGVLEFRERVAGALPGIDLASAGGYLVGGFCLGRQGSGDREEAQDKQGQPCRQESSHRHFLGSPV